MQIATGNLFAMTNIIYPLLFDDFIFLQNTNFMQQFWFDLNSSNFGFCL